LQYKVLSIAGFFDKKPVCIDETLVLS